MILLFDHNLCKKKKKLLEFSYEKTHLGGQAKLI